MSKDNIILKEFIANLIDFKRFLYIILLIDTLCEAGGNSFVVLLKNDLNIITFIKLRGCIKYMTSIAESNSLIRND